MRPGRLVGLLATGLVVALAARATPGASPGRPGRQNAASNSHSVWDGVYTEAQARRGAAVYQELCAPCHGIDLAGGEMAPPLSGPAFMANWSDLTLNDLYDRIRLTMPPDRAGGLPRQDNIDIIAYLLQVNHFPAGKTELEAKPEILMQIKVEMK